MPRRFVGAALATMTALPLVEPPAMADHAPPSVAPRESVRELEHRYPGLWRAGQLGRAGRLPVCATGYDALSAELPGGGWPAGAVTELLLGQDGAGELRLLMPALRTLAADGRRIGLVNPPYLPNAASLVSGGLPARQLYWVRPTSAATLASQRTDMLWSAEQMLRSPEALRRLQVLAQAGDAVVWVLRPLRDLRESSPAVLRLALSPLPGNLMSIVFHKRRGPVRDTPLLLPLEGMAHVPQRTGAPAVSTPVMPAMPVSSHHVADDVLDRGAFAAPVAGRAAAELA
jgi:protein ImuA